MTKLNVFVQVHGRPGLIEAEVSEAATLHDIRELLHSSGVANDTLYIFVDDAEEPHHGGPHDHLVGIRHGCRIHATQCRKVHVTVNFGGKSIDRDFAPGVRVKVVKQWAVHEFKMAPQDGAEHVLQVCGSGLRPASDTPLNELVQENVCGVAFDLVPDVRVEG